MSPTSSEPGGLTPGQRDLLLQIVDERFGIRGSDYGASRIDAAIQKVLPHSGSPDVPQLLATLDEASSESPRWLFEVVESLTVGETYFLRDPAQITALREMVLPEAVARHTDTRRLRLWSAGCSTGEEVYTLAILLKERHLPTDWDVTLLGTDVNRESLRIAREGAYPAWSFRATPEPVRERYFDTFAKGWRLKEALRHMARFAWANLGADPLLAPLNEVDLIMCRNVTIYFDDLATQRLYRGLVGALAPGGWLMLGPSDPLPADREGLERIEIAGTVLWRRHSPTLPPPSRPVTPTRQTRPPTVRTRTADLAQARAHAGHHSAHTPKTELGHHPADTAKVEIGHAAAETAKAEVGHDPADAAKGHAAPLAADELHAEATASSQDLEAGLLALESGEPIVAVDWLRRATFRDPSSAMAQFALARAYVTLGDRPRAHAALLFTRRLLAPLASDELVPGSDSLAVETVRQTVQTYLEDIEA